MGDSRCLTGQEYDKIHNDEKICQRCLAQFDQKEEISRENQSVTWKAESIA
jgi:hypothetical protein